MPDFYMVISLRDNIDDTQRITGLFMVNDSPFTLIRTTNYSDQQYSSNSATLYCSVCGS